MTVDSAWGQEDQELVCWLEQHRANTSKAYGADRLLLEEHANQEDSYRTGGYSRRQILELVQNAADAQQASGRGRIEVRLVDGVLYCANEGKAFSREGLEAICHAFLSDKRDEAIGRFGLGFKSVLGITGNPAVFSRSISFDFDAERATEEFRQLDPSVKRSPVLRMPAHLDVTEEMRRDAVLADLAEWATTIIRLPLSAGADRLERELEEFPLEFLLFVPRVSVLRIVVDRPGRERVELEHECIALGDDVLRLQTMDREPSDWRVWRCPHHPSSQALQEVGEAIRRQSLTVTWAVPLASGVSTLGRFWAYYPLTETTSLRGILNAPWQINDDRTSLLPGRFNQEILERIAALVVEGLQALSSPADPARHFDYLPARGREAPNFADRFLTVRVPQLVASSECIPDRDGVLRGVGDLRFPHLDQIRLDPAMLTAWYSAPAGPRSVPHIGCFRTNTRQARLKTLIRADDQRAASVELTAPAWLALLVGDEATDKECASALRVVAATKDSDTRSRFLSARVLPDCDGRLRPLSATGDVFLRGDALTSQAEISLVRQSFLELPEIESCLRELGFQNVNPGDELAKLTRANTKKWTGSEWVEFWRLVSDVPRSEARQHLEDHLANGRFLKVKCRDGWWHYSHEVVIADKVQPQSSAMVLDEDFHDLDRELMRRIGIVAEPVTSRALGHDSTYLEYLRLTCAKYLETLPTRGRPPTKELGFLDHDPVGPLHVLRRFRDSGDVEACTGWTDALLRLDTPAKWIFGRVTRKSLPSIEVPAPSVWAAREYGLLATPWGPRPAKDCVARALSPYAPFLPVAEWRDTDKLSLPDSMPDIAPGIWREFLGRVPLKRDAWTLGALVAHAADALPENEMPDYVPAISGSSGCRVQREELLIARTEEENRVLAQRRSAYVAVSDDALATILFDKWGCTPASLWLRVEVMPENPAEPVLVLDRYRGLRPLADGSLDGVELVECGDLFRQITGPDGVDREPADLLRDGSVVYCRAALQDEDLLTRLAAEFHIELTTSLIDRILEDAQDEEVRTRIAMCRKERDYARKLLRLLDAETLEARLPTGLLDTVRKLDDDGGASQVARLLVDVHGYDVLRELRQDLEAAGFPVPDRWAGSPPAVGFVRSLGFPTEYAGERGSHLEPDLTVLGPPRLGPLHVYQQELADRIRRLVADRSRGLLFLPTGAGKTRVTVQALATAYIEDGLTGHLLWVAQSEELCEQAVQTWSTVWRDLGDGRALRICRLWDRNEIAAGENELMVVVATDAKLAVCRDNPDYAWLAKPAAVVIDEAHEATGKEYNKLLTWLGLDTRQSGPLLGLTATPFKGTSEEMTRRLVGRFGANMLDVLGDDPYGRLQELGVLSRVEHRILDGGTISLDAHEAETTERTRMVPPSVLERLGRDEARTLRLLEHIAGLPSDWPVLVFAASVLSAQVLAALLRVREIPAASISGSTRIHERRRSIELFRRGEIRVLTNFNVLTQGFDVPGVRALYIARPTFSPNAYIQMVGRGLRGPANGGKAECLVVNVEDTFGQFGERLAFKSFDHLWERQGGQQT